MFTARVTLHRVLKGVKTLNNVYKVTTASFSSRTVTKYHQPHHFGIDLGSTNTYIAVMEHGNHHPKLFKKLPSGFSLSPKFINDAEHDQDYITGLKRLLGRKFDDPIVQKEIKRVPYKIVKCPIDGDACIETSDGDRVPPFAVLGVYLEQIQDNIESCLGSPITRAVFAYPPLMEGTNPQIVNISLAAAIIGIKLQRFISEPVAAALAYVNGGFVKKKEGSVFAVVDLGGRTFDVSLLKVSSSGRFDFMRPTKSDIYLGGADFDSALVDHFVSECSLCDEAKSCMVKQSTPLTREILRSLRKATEVAKIQLSSERATTIKVPFIDETRKIWVQDTSLSRYKFEAVIEHLIEKVIDHCQSSLKEAGITANDVDEVLLVGGMAKMPIIQEIVTQVFGKRPCTGVNPEEAVILGAATSVHAGHFGEDAWNYQWTI